MKIVDAVWEKRNIGVETTEITLEKDDSPEEIQSVLDACKAPYQVVKVPPQMVFVNQLLTQNGFFFIETICKLKNNTMSIKQDFITERIKYQMQCHEMNEKELKMLFSELDKGIFYTDRIALDPYFSVERANDRYKGWIKDAVEQGAVVLSVMYKADPICFIIYKQKDTRIDALVGGIYSEYSKGGLGLAAYSKGYEFISENGGKEAYTAVSTNNLASLKSNIAIGYQIYEFEYVFVKHNI